MADAAFALAKPGDKAGPIQTDKGVELVRLQNKTTALDKKFEDVKEMVRQRLARERRSHDYDDFIAKLRTQANVKVFDDEIAKLPNPEGMPGAPAAMAPNMPHPPGMPVPMSKAPEGAQGLPGRPPMPVKEASVPK